MVDWAITTQCLLFTPKYTDSNRYHNTQNKHVRINKGRMGTPAPSGFFSSLAVDCWYHYCEHVATDTIPKQASWIALKLSTMHSCLPQDIQSN